MENIMEMLVGEVASKENERSVLEAEVTVKLVVTL